MPSPETSRLNLQKAWAKWRPPKPWRSKQETLVIKRIVWQWFNYRRTDRWSGRKLARRLCVSHTYIQKLRRQFLTDPTEIQRQRAQALYGPATWDDLRRAQECTREQKMVGRLRYSLLSNRFRNRPEVLDLRKVYLPVSPVVPPFQEDDVMVRVMNRLRQRERDARLRRNVSATGY